ncbi:hypothetical protein BASA81_013832 [Batrachochytrium salamandrivorans]|nr:hypothetical protein BASA81_013832 [Batrachochytrium salamandrivorans]
MKMGDLEGLIGFLDDEEEEEKAAPSKQSKFDASVYSSSRSALPALKLSPYFQVNWKDRNPSQEVFGFRLAVESSSPFVDLFRAVPTISLHLLLHKKPVCPNKFVVVVVVKSRSPTRENAASNLPYQEWILTDLQGTEGRLLVFGEAFKQYEHGFGACKHPVLVLKTPSVLGSCLTVHYSNQLEICGESRDFAQCKSCPMATNSFISKYCPTHAEEEMRVCAANRSNVSIMSRQRKPPSTTVAAPHTITATSEYHTGIVLKPQVKDNRTLSSAASSGLSSRVRSKTHQVGFWAGGREK